MASESRGRFNTSLGFVLAAAGSAIGLGNIWKFPYIVGKFGGGAFVVIYIIMIFIIGFTILLAETALGRHGQTNMIDAYNKIHPKFGFIGVLNFLGSFLLLSYYGVLGGWVTNYLFVSITKGLVQPPLEYFEEFTARPLLPLLFIAIFILLYAWITSGGIAKGIEKFNSISMPLLLIMLIILAIRGCTLPGSAEGIVFYLKPDFSKVTLTTIAVAAGQAFYSLSLGMGAMTTYGSYLSKKQNIIKDAYWVPILDTVVALLCGFAIIPAVFALGMSPSQGPGLMFVTLPSAFGKMPFGRIVSILFFCLVLFAALTSAISLFENLVAVIKEKFHLSRRKTICILAPVLFVFGVLPSLSFGVLKEFKILGLTIFEGMDSFVSNFIFPLCTLLLCVFISVVWKIKNAVAEITSNGIYPFRIKKIWAFMIRFMVPAGILIILANSFMGNF